ncbi:DNA-binding CsgD family transcriptional regulator [Mesoflavibacter sabulilitoris]|nr:hypothetical protein [Mesoflavibacter zeaxanthinifaciens]MBB3123365.1 DNA-binding CsgD family transcriptional regulator [Mesoflavibacter zeaxanthinifaciens subsp. sabulilitoris]
MSKTFNLRKTNSVNSNIVLNHLELFYLRLYTHGLNNKEISEFLDLDLSKIYKIRKSISELYNTSDWIKIISSAFEDKVLYKVDYIDQLVKDVALQHTQILFNKYVSPIYLSLTIEELRHRIIEFYYECEIKLTDNYYNEIDYKKLNTKELQYLNLKYENINSKVIFEKLKLRKSEEKLRELKFLVFNKLRVNNWFNAFKIGLKLNLLDVPKNHLENVEKEVINCTNKIIRIRTIKRLSFTEKKLSIYNELLELYTNIEFSKFINHANSL